MQQCDRDALASDPWRSNLYSAPSQGSTYLFQKEEGEMRRKLIEADLIEYVHGLGPNLFYNWPMDPGVVVRRT